MNVWLWVGILCTAVGIAVCGSLFVRKYAMLRMLDPDTSRSTRERKLRNRIMEERMQRTVHVQFERLVHFLFIPWRFFRDAFRRLAGKLVALERRYHRERVREVQISSEELQAMLADAERALREDRLQIAEERLVELISAAPKFAQAYETLSRVYSKKKEWKDAVESLSCYVKLAPKDAEGHFLLGSLCEEMRERDRAFVEYTAALEREPHNPKYLCAYIVLAHELYRRADALRGLQTLREVNPENAKIAHFSSLLGELNDESPRIERKRKK